MAAVMPAPAQSRLLLSGNEAVARAVWESGCRVAAAYPGTPSTEMLEVISTYPDVYAEWSVNEKASLEVAIGAAFACSSSFTICGGWQYDLERCARKMATEHGPLI